MSADLNKAAELTILFVSSFTNYATRTRPGCSSQRLPSLYGHTVCLNMLRR